MIKNIFIAAFLFITVAIKAQTTASNGLYANAKTLMREGDYENATLVFDKLLVQEPNNMDVLKDYAYLAYLKRDFTKCIEASKKIIEKPEADEQSYQLLGMAYKDIADNKECLKLYKAALKKFPNSGVINNDMGELLAAARDFADAIVYWEKGIESDPDYSSNYYNAAMYYLQKNNTVWAIIYGEIFVNLESYTTRTADMKALLLDSYKKIFQASTDVPNKKVSAFEKAFTEYILKSGVQLNEGVNSFNLVSIRTRFILDWYYNEMQIKFPFRLFDQMRYLLREGLFGAYNQWIFGVAASPANYKTWADTFSQESNAFKNYQQSRVFKLAPNQYYRY